MISVNRYLNRSLLRGLSTSTYASVNNYYVHRSVLYPSDSALKYTLSYRGMHSTLIRPNKFVSDKKLEGSRLASCPKTPAKAALTQIFFAEFCIFFIFGFCDNFIMMMFGDQIESYFRHHSLLGHSLMLHPMIAAALGNWVSDVFGMATGERVETTMQKQYMTESPTMQQQRHKSYHRNKYSGRFAGITGGCLIGAIAAWPFLEDEDDHESCQPNSTDSCS